MDNLSPIDPFNPITMKKDDVASYLSLLPTDSNKNVLIIQHSDYPKGYALH